MLSFQTVDKNQRLDYWIIGEESGKFEETSYRTQNQYAALQLVSVIAREITVQIDKQIKTQPKPIKKIQSVTQN